MQQQGLVTENTPEHADSKRALSLLGMLAAHIAIAESRLAMCSSNKAMSVFALDGFLYTHYAMTVSTTKTHGATL